MKSHDVWTSKDREHHVGDLHLTEDEQARFAPYIADYLSGRTATLDEILGRQAADRERRNKQYGKWGQA